MPTRSPVKFDDGLEKALRRRLDAMARHDLHPSRNWDRCENLSWHSTMAPDAPLIAQHGTTLWRLRELLISAISVAPSC